MGWIARIHEDDGDNLITSFVRSEEDKLLVAGDSAQRACDMKSWLLPCMKITTRREDEQHQIEEQVGFRQR